MNDIAAGAPSQRLPARPRFTLAVIVLCQALAMTGVTMVIVVSALAGAMLAPDKSLATLPIALLLIEWVFLREPRRFGSRRDLAARRRDRDVAAGRDQASPRAA